MVRPVEQKKRSRCNRQRNKIILIGTEGKNKTETLYFNGIKQHIPGYNILFAKGNDTDPIKIVKNTIKSSDKNHQGLDLKHGDLVSSVFHTDTDITKQSFIEKAIEYGENHNVKVILSNPCFEVWFLQHFRYSSKALMSSKEAVDELRRYLPEYRKNKDISDKIWPNTTIAIRNCNKLNDYHKKNGKTKCLELNPSSEVSKFFEIILQGKEK